MEDKRVVPDFISCGETAGTQTVPLDFAGCVEMLGGDRVMVLSLLGDFSGHLELQIKDLAVALAEANCEVVRQVAHSIKGGAAVLCAEPLKDAAASLEAAGKAGDLAQVEEGLLVVESEAARLLCYCKSLSK